VSALYGMMVLMEQGTRNMIQLRDPHAATWLK